MAAVSRGEDWAAATVWFPKVPEEATQGWDNGVKVAIRDPLAIAIPFRASAWWLFKFHPHFRRFQATYSFIGSRAWAVA
jgi:hypothetical protein